MSPHTAARLLGSTCILFLITTTSFAQTGEISGRIVTAKHGEPINGVNVTIDDTFQGSFTQADGYYVILGVRPGDYVVTASSIGYTPQSVTNVRVNIGLTTTINFQLEEETVGLDEVIIKSKRPIVQRDVSASVANIDFEEVESLPLTNLQDIISLQPGFEPVFSIRGSIGFDRISVLVDGMDLSSGRTLRPYLGISYTSIDEVQVQTGGFNAEYGDLRAGLINVVTRDGLRDRYTADVLFRYGPPHQPYFPGIDLDGNEVPMPNSLGSYWVRPYFDPDVAFAGTQGGTWDPYTFDSYPSFIGWDYLARFSPRNLDDDLHNDVAPEQMMEAFRWYLRKDLKIDRPEYVIDGTIGGPVPGISRKLGDLRFTTSLRRTATPYIIPLNRDEHTDISWQGKLTSNFAPGIRLHLLGLWAKEWGLNASNFGGTGMITGYMSSHPWYGNDLAGSVSTELLFRTHMHNPMEVTRAMVGLHLTQALTSRTFYDVKFERMRTDYFTHTGTEKDLRDPSIQHVVPPPPDCSTCGPIELDGAPFGWEPFFQTDVLGVGLTTGGNGYTARDSSRTTRFTGSFDLTSQVNRYAQIKTGVQVIYSNHDTNYGMVDPARPYIVQPTYRWHRHPVQGGAYVQTRLDFRGMVANLGLRADYYHPGGEWYVYEPYDRAFTSAFGADRLDDVLEKRPTRRQITLSPRLGVSYPISEKSKFFFNYGHFRQVLRPLGIFQIQKLNTGAVTALGNPNHPMPRTVAYEVGFEQSLLDLFYLRFAGYYRDQSLEEWSTHFVSIDGEVNYYVVSPLHYADHRGFEITFSKNGGDWIRGFINYTYRNGSGGIFGINNYFENPVEQREYLRTSTEHYKQGSAPRPLASMNLEFRTPDSFGPFLSGLRPLGGWRADLLGQWHYGPAFTWNGSSLDISSGRSPNYLSSNINWKDYWNFDLRLAKNFALSQGRLQFFLDIKNVLNLRYLYYFSFSGRGDLQKYMRSLHLPERTFEQIENEPYRFIYGNDLPGDYRKPGIRFTPIEIVDRLPAAGLERPLYYVWDEQSYYWYRDGRFSPADEAFVEDVLEKKAYINMPDVTNFTFLNPRSFYLGVRIDF